MLVRKSPYRHPVSAYTKEDGTDVDNYIRGSGGLPSVKLANPALSLRLPSGIETPSAFSPQEEPEVDDVGGESDVKVLVNEAWDGGTSIIISGLSEDMVDVVRKAEQDKLDNKLDSEALGFYLQNVVPLVQSHVDPSVYAMVPTAKFWGSVTGDDVHIEVGKPEQVGGEMF